MKVVTHLWGSCFDLEGDGLRIVISDCEGAFDQLCEWS